jgi:hypothetical protein
MKALKTCKKGCSKMQSGGPVKKVKKMAQGSIMGGIPQTGTTNYSAPTMAKGGKVTTLKKRGMGGMHMMPDGTMMKDSMMKKGGSLKTVPSGKVGLSKLPTAVRNKMGYQKKGGTVKRK